MSLKKISIRVDPALLPNTDNLSAFVRQLLQKEHICPTINHQFQCLPCPEFSLEEANIIRKYGFITHPCFVDNGFAKKDGIQWERAKREIKRRRPIFFIANDEDPFCDLKEISRYCTHIICPVHTLNSDYLAFDWLGFPHRPKFRDYSLKQFLDWSEGQKRWYLGFWKASHPQILRRFDGWDSTMPETYSGKYGKLWKNWNEYEKAPEDMLTIEIFEENVKNFRRAIDQIMLGNQQELNIVN